MIGTDTSIMQAVSSALPERGEIRSAVPMHKGFSSEAWLVESLSGPLVAKIALRYPDGSRLANAAAAGKIARHLGVPTPPFLHLSTSQETFGGRAFSVSEFMPGQDGQDTVPSMDRETRARLFGEWGMVVGRLHMIERDMFAEDALGSGATSSWADAVTARLAALPGKYKEAGMAFDAIADAVGRLQASVGEVSRSVRPVLAHCDLYLANILVTEERLAGLLDFEHARFWDPVSDFVKLMLFVFHDFPEARPAFLDGYQQMRKLPEAFFARLSIALGLELVSMIPFFYRWGDKTGLATCQQWLAQWLISGEEVVHSFGQHVHMI
jgi:Ser/Thr protein kinase RdoA (MazF antagonist)